MISTTTIESQLQALTEVYSSVQTLRHVPQVLLQSPVNSNALPLPAPSFMLQFQQLKDLAQSLRSEPVQSALQAARDSETADGSNIANDFRREHRKRRRPPSPESPQPYIASERQLTSLFPSTNDNVAPLKIQDLIDYIRSFNKERSTNCKLQIWQATRSGTQQIMQNPTILRFTIKDVLTAYLTAGYTSDDPSLAVETVTVFGPRERKSPHSQSDYTVYRILSQQLGRMIQSEPQIEFQRIMELLCTYEKMFMMRCERCERVICTESHVAAVERVWNESKWMARHVSCR